jgi:hypothetical protein
MTDRFLRGYIFLTGLLLNVLKQDLTLVSCVNIRSHAIEVAPARSGVRLQEQVRIFKGQAIAVERFA